MIIPPNTRAQPINSINVGRVFKKNSAIKMVKGICSENKSACRLGPSRFKQIYKKVSPIMMPINEDKKIIKKTCDSK